MLRLPEEDGLFILDCDASDKAIGGVLSQIQNGEERPICYASQLYDKHQRNYNVTRKEFLAMVTFVKKFRQYLLGRKFLIRTDHAALQWLKRTPEPIGQQARWLEILEEFDFEIQHRAGSKHCNADSLSRSIDAVTNETGPLPSQTAPIDWPQEQKNDPDVGLVYDLVRTRGPFPDAAELNGRSAELKTLCHQAASLSIEHDGTLVRRFYRKGRTTPSYKKWYPIASASRAPMNIIKG